MIARVYAALIRKGLKTLDDVPETLRETVDQLLRETAGGEQGR